MSTEMQNSLQLAQGPVNRLCRHAQEKTVTGVVLKWRQGYSSNICFSTSPPAHELPSLHIVLKGTP